ncbi:MAG: transpeptidase family protein [Flavobacteriales bacterium]|nr:transpeptidase family protein [Flavobacteriales bacterium]
MNALNSIRARANLVYLVVVLFALAIAVKLFTIQIAEGDHWRERAEHVAYAYRTVQPDRGHVLSADDRLLATSVPEYEIYMDMLAGGLTKEVFEAGVDSLAWHLAELFQDRSQREYERELRDARARKKRYHRIKRKVDHAQVQQLKTFPLFRKGQYGGGLIVQHQTVRRLPFKRLAQRTIGYVSGDSSNVSVGLEGGYNKWLKGVTGKRLERRLAGGVWMPIDDGKGIDHVPGSDIHTTIDINLQDVADAALEAQLRKHGAQYGCVVVMEVATGHIKAISNLTRRNDSTFVEDLNYAVGQATEPGSTFKLAALMVGLEDGLMAPGDTVDTRRGEVRFHNAVMRDSHEGGYGRITLQRAFEVSSNTGISQAIDKAYKKEPRRFVEGLRRMGLGSTTGVLIPGEPEPTLRGPGDNGWSGLSLPWMSIGYEMAYTPLQMLAFYNAVANNGRMMQPQFVRRISRNGRTVEEFKPVVLNERICSQRTLDVARGMLQGVVDSGTATNLRAAHFSVAGKTGTAQIARNGSYTQHGKSYQASFVGYFPADKPVYSCIVVVNGPTMSGYYGNVVAGPIFKEIADKIYSNRLELQQPQLNQMAQAPRAPLSYSGNAEDLRIALRGLDVPFDDAADGDWASTQAGDTTVALLPRSLPSEQDGMVPNVLGMGLRDALYILESRGLRVRFSGSGMVRRQSIQAGSKAPRGSTIHIELT